VKNRKWYKTALIYAVIFLFVIGMALLYTQGQSSTNIKEVTFTKFVSELADENITKLEIKDTSLTGELKDGSTIHAYAPSSIQLMSINDKYIMPQVESGSLTLESTKPQTTPWYISMLPYLLTIVIFVGLWIFFMNSSQGGAGRAMLFGKSKAHMVNKDDNKVTFDDVAGLKEEKEELREIVDFLQRPGKYTRMGARIPKGVLLVGPPGTGKTYVTKAVAGEAGVPFFSISGSDFVEMFVGVGASRVRDLFEQAKKNAPSIIFIDEIDAVGRRRGAGLGGGHDEREQTLNQMLVEMDGFGVNEGVIVFAATNRPDVLDPALLRPGRFDRQITIGLPDVTGREEVFRVHAKNKPLDDSVDLGVLARMTPGFSPADIENILNEASLLTVRRGGKTIGMDEMEEAITRVMAGPAKKSRKVTEAERKLTAFHEAGHAVLIRCLPNSDPVHQITIVPHGMAGGMTMFLPNEDRSFESKTRMEDSLVHLLGGRVAEQLVLGDISTGASNDIQRATEIARNMVARYGMSEKVGAINYSGSQEVFIGKDFAEKKEYSEATAALIDSEVKRLIDEAYQRAETLLTENMDKLHLVAETLLEVETLDAEQFEDLFTGARTKEEVVAEVREKAEKMRKKIDAQKKREKEEEAAEEARRRQEMADQDEFMRMVRELNPDDIVFKHKNGGNAGNGSSSNNSGSNNNAGGNSSASGSSNAGGSSSGSSDGNNGSGGSSDNDAR
jgi:cell division protease FtsH